MAGSTVVINWSMLPSTDRPRDLLAGVGVQTAGLSLPVVIALALSVGCASSFHAAGSEGTA
jgi:hypothetical protein